MCKLESMLLTPYLYTFRQVLQHISHGLEPTLMPKYVNPTSDAIVLSVSAHEPTTTHVLEPLTNRTHNLTPFTWFWSHIVDCQQGALKMRIEFPSAHLESENVISFLRCKAAVASVYTNKHKVNNMPCD